MVRTSFRKDWFRRDWFLGACLAAALGAHAVGQTVVVPNANATVAGNDNSGLPLNTTLSIEAQTVIDPDQFPSEPIYITGIAYRAAPGLGPLSITATASIYLSTSPNYANSNGHPLLSTTFANNVGPDNTLVFSGSNVNISGAGCAVSGTTPCPWANTIVFTTPFLYNPAYGPLLIDAKDTSLNVTSGQYDVADCNLASCSTANIYTSPLGSPTAKSVDYNATIIQLTYTPASSVSSMTYHYTGTPFTLCGYGTCPANYTSDYIVASISFAAPLAPGLPLTDLTSSLTAWTVGDALGYFSFSSTGPTSSYLTGFPSMGIPPLSISTNSSGSIVDYGMWAFPAEVLGLVGKSEGAIMNPTRTYSCQSGSTCAIADFVEINWGLPTEWDAGSSIPGRWTSTAAATCSSLAVTPNNFTFAQGGGSGTVTFNASPCAWSITGNPSWITLPTSSGTAGSFSFTIAPNPGATSRQATLSINGGALTVAITQSGLVCTYTITDATTGFGVSRSFLSGGGGGGINVFAPPGCPWTATPNQSFITISGSASGSGNGSVNYTVAPNSSSNTQSGTIAIAGLAFVINEQPAGSQPNSCTAASTASPIRPEGYAERVADVVLQCSGQAPPGGLTGDILISFNTLITNLLLSTGQTDALLLEDEPSAANLALGTNAFRGMLSSVNGTAILFPGVQLASASGGAFSHTWRITNVRVNAEALTPGTSVQATVLITAPALFTVSGQPTVAFISSASLFLTPAPTTASGQTTQPVNFTEGFATAFNPRLAANQDPSQVGAVYNSESGYVNTAKLGSQTGFATSATRLIVSIANVPAGVSVYAPLVPASGTNAELVSADATGAGGSPVSGAGNHQITLNSGAGTATWEVTASNPNTIETLTFNLVLVNPNNVSLAGVTYAGALAPVSSGLAPQLPSTNLPVPRFASSKVVVPPPATVGLSVAPQQSPAQPALKSALRSAASTPSSNAVGGTVTWTQTQANTGAAAASTAPNVSVGGTLPPTWVITSCTAVDSGGVCPTINPNNPSNSFSATYPSLSPGQTGTIMLTAQSDSQSSGTVEYSSSIDSDLANSDLTTGTFTANFTVSQIGLNVTLTNASSFSQGQTGAQYSVTVSNGGNLPTSLPVTVTETLPAGLTLVSMAGDGWTCTVATSSCTRSDVLAGNSSYPSITVTVNVSSNAPSSVINEVTATTGVLQATGSDTTNITTGTAPGFFSGQISLGSGVYYLQFFGYYNYPAASILYHYDLGFEAFIPGSAADVYLYDFTTGHWWYTSASLFPYLYDFTLNNWLYYFSPTTSPRSFSDLTTGKIITM